MGYEIANYASPHVESVEELDRVFNDGKPDRIGFTTEKDASHSLVAAIEYCDLIKEPWRDTQAGKTTAKNPAADDKDVLRAISNSIAAEYNAAKELV